MLTEEDICSGRSFDDAITAINMPTDVFLPDEIIGEYRRRAGTWGNGLKLLKNIRAGFKPLFFGFY
ncbi:MAG: hypothetical protein ACOX8Q_03945 [Christensenellales bacterium]